MKSGLECDVEEVFNKFINLTAEEMQKATKRALVAGAKELQRKTKENLSGTIKNRNNEHWYDGKLIVYNDRIDDAVRRGKVVDDAGEELSTSVHIMGTRKTGSGTYRARFLEKGTRQRFAKHYRDRNGQLKTYKKPRYLGSIKGRWFFRNAQQSVFPNLPSIYLKEIDKTINKLNNTKI